MIEKNNFSHPFYEDVFHFKHIHSTSQKAEQLIRNKEASGNILVIADTQTGGIGRNKRRWVSPEGGLWFTSGIFGLSVASKFTIFTGIVLHKTLISLYPQMANHLKIKWPNDLYLNDRKVAGILSSYLPRHRYHFLGIGINTNIEKFDEKLDNIPISIRNFLGVDIDNMALLSHFTDLFSATLPDIVEDILDIEYYNKNSLLKGSNVVLDTDFDQYQGKMIGISKEGAILLEIKPGMIQPFLAGSIVDFTLAENTK